MARGRWKGYFCEKQVLRSVQRLIDRGGPQAQKTPLFVFSRRSAILPEFVGYRFQIHTGNAFRETEVEKLMVGKKFGEFAWSRNTDDIEEYDEMDERDEQMREREEARAEAAKAAPKAATPTKK